MRRHRATRAARHGVRRRRRWGACGVVARAPSPATSLVALATCLTRDAPRFWNLHLSSMLLATVTPSFVIFGPPYGCSMTTLRPCSARAGARRVSAGGRLDGQAGRPPLASARLRPQRDLHRVRQAVHALQHQAARLDAEADVLRGIAAREEQRRALRRHRRCHSRSQAPDATATPRQARASGAARPARTRAARAATGLLRGEARRRSVMSSLGRLASSTRRAARTCRSRRAGCAPAASEPAS